MSGNLYQLKTSAPLGGYVVIDGPYDRYGKVVGYKQNGYHLIRGLGMTKPDGVSTFHSTE